MKRTIAYLLVLLIAIPVNASAHAVRVIDCQDVSTYFARVDEGIADGISGLIEQPGFREVFERANGNDTGFLALPSEEQEAVIQFLSVPRDALEGIDDDDIPGPVRDLHHSAVTYWTQMPGMMQAIANDGPSAGMPFARDLETATIDNDMAQQELIAACSDEVGAYAEQSERIGADALGDDLLAVWGNIDADEPDGVGYGFLFFATEDDLGDETGAALELDEV